MNSARSSSATRSCPASGRTSTCRRSSRRSARAGSSSRGASTSATTPSSSPPRSSARFAGDDVGLQLRRHRRHARRSHARSARRARPAWSSRCIPTPRPRSARASATRSRRSGSMMGEFPEGSEIIPNPYNRIPGLQLAAAPLSCRVSADGVADDGVGARYALPRRSTRRAASPSARSSCAARGESQLIDLMNAVPRALPAAEGVQPAAHGSRTATSSSACAATPREVADRDRRAEGRA